MKTQAEITHDRMVESLKDIVPIAQIWYAHIKALYNAHECDESWGKEIPKYKLAIDKAKELIK